MNKWINKSTHTGAQYMIVHTRQTTSERKISTSNKCISISISIYSIHFPACVCLRVFVLLMTPAWFRISVPGCLLQGTHEAKMSASSWETLDPQTASDGCSTQPREFHGKHDERLLPQIDLGGLKCVTDSWMSVDTQHLHHTCASILVAHMQVAMT